MVSEPALGSPTFRCVCQAKLAFKRSHLDPARVRIMDYSEGSCPPISPIDGRHKPLDHPDQVRRAILVEQVESST